MEENTIKIILAIITVVATIVGGTLYYKKTTKVKKRSTTIKGISITGNDNKVIGGNDNSVK